MRKTRPEDFDPNYKKPEQTGPRPEEINMDGVVSIKPRKKIEGAQTPQNPKHVEKEIMVSRHRDTMTPRYHDTVIPRYHDAVEAVRQAVKETGKEAATHRFTVAEKRAVAEIIFAYSQQGIKTSENEIARIAINYLIADYRENGEESVLAQVLSKLNS